MILRWVSIYPLWRREIHVLVLLYQFFQRKHYWSVPYSFYFSPFEINGLSDKECNL